MNFRPGTRTKLPATLPKTNHPEKSLVRFEESMVILILGGMDDTHACHMLETLRDRRADVEILDSRWFPGFMQMSHDPIRGTGTIRLPTGRRLGWEDVAAVYWRCYNMVTPPNLP